MLNHTSPIRWYALATAVLLLGGHGFCWLPRPVLEGESMVEMERARLTCYNKGRLGRSFSVEVFPPGEGKPGEGGGCLRIGKVESGVVAGLANSANLRLGEWRGRNKPEDAVCYPLPKRFVGRLRPICCYDNGPMEWDFAISEPVRLYAYIDWKEEGELVTRRKGWQLDSLHPNFPIGLYFIDLEPGRQKLKFGDEAVVGVCFFRSSELSLADRSVVPVAVQKGAGIALNINSLLPYEREMIFYYRVQDAETKENVAQGAIDFPVKTGLNRKTLPMPDTMVPGKKYMVVGMLKGDQSTWSMKIPYTVPQ
jgi:hypothetical protein